MAPGAASEENVKIFIVHPPAPPEVISWVEALVSELRSGNDEVLTSREVLTADGEEWLKGIDAVLLISSSAARRYLPYRNRQPQPQAAFIERCGTSGILLTRTAELLREWQGGVSERLETCRAAAHALRVVGLDTRVRNCLRRSEFNKAQEALNRARNRYPELQGLEELRKAVETEAAGRSFAGEDLTADLTVEILHLPKAGE